MNKVKKERSEFCELFCPHCSTKVKNPEKILIGKRYKCGFCEEYFVLIKVTPLISETY